MTPFCIVARDGRAFNSRKLHECVSHFMKTLARSFTKDDGVMAIPTQLTGMTGVYLTAAELSRRGFIVSPTSRSAKGADLLVTDQCCLKTWSVQVKTNAKDRYTWRLSEEARDLDLYSDSHLFVFGVGRR